jgi:hypothetical protein
MAICGSAISDLIFFGIGGFADFCRLKSPPIQKYSFFPYKYRLKMLYEKKFGWTTCGRILGGLAMKGAKLFKRSVPSSLSFVKNLLICD